MYSGAITVSATQTIKAIAVAPGLTNSAVATATYIIAAAIPVLSPAAGTYTSAQSVTITDATTGAAIYYTTDGTAPTTSSNLYSGAITVSATQTIKAIAVAPGLTNSAGLRQPTPSNSYSVKHDTLQRIHRDRKFQRARVAFGRDRQFQSEFCFRVWILHPVCKHLEFDTHGHL